MTIDILLNIFYEGNGYTFNEIFYNYNLPCKLTKKSYKVLLDTFDRNDLNDVKWMDRKNKFLNNKRIFKFLFNH